MLAALCVHNTGLAPESENNIFFLNMKSLLTREDSSNKSSIYNPFLSVTEDVDDESYLLLLYILFNSKVVYVRRMIKLLISG